MSTVRPFDPEAAKARAREGLPPESADGAELLTEMAAFLHRFVAYPSVHAEVAHALWIAHTHAMDAWESTPRIAFLSPEPGSGKTRALEVSELLVPRPVEAINATPAYLFRKVSDPDGPPTILFDEIDTLFGAKAKEHEEIRGILNAGHRRGAMAGRCVVHGNTVTTEEWPAYCAVALAGLGNIPDTMLTRSVAVRMQRRAPHEHIVPYRRRVYVAEGHALRDRLAAWLGAIEGQLSAARPDMPDGVEDRAADVWEALLAIADAAGGGWPVQARAAAVDFVTTALESSPSLGVRLLADLRIVFAKHEKMSTAYIVTELIQLDEAPWADLRGHPIDARRLANYLRPYAIRSKLIRTGSGPNDVARGYAREDLHDAWERYLPPSPDTAVTSVTTVTPQGSCGVSEGSSVTPEGPSVTTVTPPLGTSTPVTSVTDVTDPEDLEEGAIRCKDCQFYDRDGDAGTASFCLKLNKAMPPDRLHDCAAFQRTGP